MADKPAASPEPVEAKKEEPKPAEEKKAEDKKPEEKKEESKPAAAAAEGKKPEEKNDEEMKPAAEKKKATKKRKRAEKPAAAAPAEPARTLPKRQSKAVEHFTVGASETKEPEIQKGAGTAFKDIENIETRVSGMKASTSILKKLFSVLYPGFGRGKGDIAKKYVREFSGFVVPADEKEKAKFEANVTAKLEKCTTAELKDMALVCDVERSGNKPELVKRLYDFLCKPVSSGKEYTAKKVTSGSASSKKSSKKGSGKGKGSKKEKKAGGTKRGPTSFMLYSSEHRDEVKKAHPDMKITEIATELGKMWKALSEEEQQEYKDKAAKLKPTDAGEKKKKAPKKKASKKKKEKEDTESEGEEEEEEEGEKKKKTKKQKTEKKEEKAEEKPIEPALKAKLEAAVKKLLADAKLEEVTPRWVREQLKGEFGASVEEHKDVIRHIAADVAAELAKQKDKKPAAAAEEKAKSS